MPRKASTLFNSPCKRCGKERLFPNHATGRARASRQLCQPCAVAEYNETRPRQSREERSRKAADWYQRNKTQQAIYYAGHRDRIRQEMVKAFGGKCSHCGESDPVVLVLDHINDNAKEDRKQNHHTGGYGFYMLLKSRSWPTAGLQLLCHNCNYRKEFFRRRNAVKKRQAS